MGQICEMSGVVSNEMSQLTIIAINNHTSKCHSECSKKKLQCRAMQNNAEQNANWVQMMMMPYLDGSFGQTKLGGQLATSWPWHVVLLEEFIFEFSDLFARECGAIPTDTGIVLLGCVQWWAAAICKDFQEKNNKIRWLVMRQRQNCNVEMQSSWNRGQQSH